MSERAQYVVGIDLGTTHSVVAFVPLAQAEAQVSLLPVEQLTAPGTVEAMSSLPSFLYVLSTEERNSAAYHLPGEESSPFVVGELARRRGVDVPERLVSSAKSWLSVPEAERTAAFLPWGAGATVEKISPVQAAARYLQRVVCSWNARFPQAPCAEQVVVLTVPASFDPVARQLTLQAAAEAGLHDVILLEEPQAAFYAWLQHRGDAWREQLPLGSWILVCDIGGGTTDFSAIRVGERDGDLSLERIAVGDHILLGGDNMDLALADALREHLGSEGVRLDAWQFRSLVQACRDAKERLLSATEACESVPVAISGRGSRLIGGTVRTELRRTRAERVLIEGFFPYVELWDLPRCGAPALLEEWGLPYAADPAVTRHLAAFVRQIHGGTRGEGLGVPRAVLFNGGVLHAAVLRERLLSVLSAWFPGSRPPEVLLGADLQQAVALGAAFYGWTQRRGGVRIRADLPHSYYVGIAAALPAVPGRRPPLRALCVAPRGLAEGSEVELPGREFALNVGQELEFRLFRSQRADQVGALIEDLDEEFEVLPPVRLRMGEQTEGGRVPVRIQARLNEVGVLELWCHERNSARRWRLEFDLRSLQRAAPGR